MIRCRANTESKKNMKNRVLNSSPLAIRMRVQFYSTESGPSTTVSPTTRRFPPYFLANFSLESSCHAQTDRQTDRQTDIHTHTSIHSHSQMYVSVAHAWENTCDLNVITNLTPHNSTHRCPTLELCQLQHANHSARRGCRCVGDTIRLAQQTRVKLMQTTD